MIKKVLLRGRLGNQLFQLSLAYRIREVTGIDCVLINQVFNQDTNKTEINKIARHLGIEVRMENLRNPIYRFLHNSSGHLTRKKYSCVDDPAKVPTIAEMFRYNVFQGYYQSAELACSSKEMLLGLRQAIYLESSKNLRVEENYSLLHIRGGDYLGPSREVFGVLGRGYYLKSVETIRRFAVITDDVEHAKKVIDSLNLGDRLIEILSPSEVSTIDTLKLACEAKNFVSSNSTFSFWGGLLCSLNGGFTYQPDPFFRNAKPTRSFALRYPRCHTIPADWMV